MSQASKLPDGDRVSLEHLWCLVVLGDAAAVPTSGPMARAARRLKWRPAKVSQTVDRLEKAFGTTIVATSDKDKRTGRLTAEGRALARAARIFFDMQEMVSANRRRPNAVDREFDRVADFVRASAAFLEKTREADDIPPPSGPAARPRRSDTGDDPR